VGDLLDLAEDALAVYRATRLATQDEISRPFRERANRDLYRAGHRQLAYLIECPFCISVWLSGALVLGRAVAPRTTALVRRTLAAAAVTALIYDRREG
jgi:hypothetical protein